MDSPFEVLGLDRDAAASDVREAYRRRVKEAHPDQGGSPEEFRRVREAYEAIRAGETVGESEPRRTVENPPGGVPTGPSGRAAPGRRQQANGDADEAEDRPDETEVEYVDYEALDERGWAVDDEDLFEKAAAADLDPDDHGRFLHGSDDSLLEGAEDCGFTWPYSCRGGACANCAVAVVDGDLEMPASHVLPEELLDRGIRLSCVGEPASEELQVVYNVRHLPDLEELLLPDGPFAGAED